MKILVKAGKTSKRVLIFIQDSSSTTGAGLAGLVFNSAGLTAYFARDDQGNAGATAITLATATLGTWTSGGFKEKDATNMPGWYELGLPDAVLAAGSSLAGVHLKGATNMAPLPIEIQLTAFDPDDTVRLGLTALPNAVPGAAGGVFIAGTNAPVTIQGVGSALTLQSTSGNGNGLQLIGQGTGHGLAAAGGATSGSGIAAVGGGGAGAGITAQGAATGAGIAAAGGGTSGPGLSALASAGNSDGITATKQGTGIDINGSVKAALTVTDLNTAQAEPTGAPAANDTPLVKLARLHQVLRNKLIVDSNTGQLKFYDDALVLLWSKALADAGGVYTESEGA